MILPAVMALLAQERLVQFVVVALSLVDVMRWGRRDACADMVTLGRRRTKKVQAPADLALH